MSKMLEEAEAVARAAERRESSTCERIACYTYHLRDVNCYQLGQTPRTLWQPLTNITLVPTGPSVVSVWIPRPRHLQARSRAGISYHPPMSDVTWLLNAIEAGEPKAADQLLPLVYEESRKLAVVRMADEKAGQKRHWAFARAWLKRTIRTSLSGQAGAD